ncbi:type III pantothenate kinase [Deinococcus peraridilitoris]|uniref:Type III pantothenate kinase n=1 Tax=Deinococcus peraridilitoris (strain DSM 19664 / LMG 22246 / CIP 109416 / KR-200) TaxID=937777 RepID=L0A5T7_DEIPD|nr:type III pantothenate kinase [Deinococcus peraridilitoris]AFZ69211.1 pantothenate kinase, type III [Deinococcus peraridilitoris DSM 19664]
MPSGPLLAVDIGNTSTVLGLTDEGLELRQTWRIRTNRDLLPDDLALMIRGLLDLAGNAPRPAFAVLSSVAPPVGQNLQLALEKYFGIHAFDVSAESLPDVRVHLDEPRAIGADRLANLFGAERYLGQHEYAIVVDFGTSTNFDVIGRGRQFLGGVLATGAQVSADALFARAAKLPRVNLSAPERALGRNTVEALQSGLVFGYAEMVDGMLRRLRAELPGPAVSVATGGFSRTIEGICREIDVFDDTLTLRGLVELWSSRPAADLPSPLPAARRG